ncbi:MAG: ribulose-phosphate 3-epimerase [Nitrospirae bacterium]|nr:ribulose-phosphate 3-epimerase [Nitrospirota bacterium]
MKIVPAVLAERFDDFVAKLRQAEAITDYVQIDIMDGLFVESASFPVEKINTVLTPLSFEAHLMVENPLSFLSKLGHPGLRKVIYHFESVKDQREVISGIRERGLVPGMALRPETGVKEFGGIAEDVDTLLFLTVDPGFYGSPFKPEVLAKVREARKAFPEKTIAVDGGVALDNIGVFLDIGVDYACVGSRIFADGNPQENYRHFAEKIRDLERV